MMKKQGVPEDQQEQMVGMFEKNPELFQKIAAEVKEKVDSGMDQQTALMQVAQKYQNDLKDLKD